MDVELDKDWWKGLVHQPWVRKRVLQILKDKFEMIPADRQTDYQIRMVDQSGTTIYNKGYGDKWEYTYSFQKSILPIGNIETCTFRGAHSEKLNHHLQRIIS